jgi:putative NADH-flavin reductase
MNLVIFGGTGPTGRHLLEQALAAGHIVTAAARHPDRLPSRAGLHAVRADVTDPDSVLAAVEGADAVLSAIGANPRPKPISVYSQAAVTLVSAMQKYGVKRLIAITSSVIDPHWRPTGAHFFNRVLDPLVNRPLAGPAHDDMRRLEAVLRDADLDWTVVRPSGLFDHPTVTRYQVAEESADGLFTARSDLAAAMLAQVGDDRFLRKAFGVITTDVKPSLVRVLFREATRAR